MTKIPFNVKFKPQIESGEYKVETATGKQARIICWDKKSDMNKKKIVALLDDGNSEHTEYYTENGTVYEKAPAGGDLFLITPEPEMSEFAVQLEQMMYDWEDREIEARKIVAEWKDKILALARKEFRPEIDAEIEKAYKNHDDVVFREGVEQGKADALKDLPRWEKDGIPTGNAAIDISGLTGFDFIRRAGRLIRISSLEKLPGFKDE